MQSRKIPHSGWNLEYIMWLFTRISGLAFYLYAIIGIVGALILGARTQMDLGTLVRWTIFPNPSHVLDSNIADIEFGWANGFWQIMQMLILIFAGTHGMNGLRVVLEDYIKRSSIVLFARFLIFLMWLFLLLVSIYVVISS